MSENKLNPVKKGFVVAIDGPAGTGKSSTTKRLADILKFVHVDTGALYRGLALLLIERGENLDRTPKEILADMGLVESATEVAKNARFEFKRNARKNPKNRILVSGRDVTELIRTPEVSMAASRVSAIPGLRQALVGFQRELGCQSNSILEGRDIGTVIFPDADMKFFLTASVEERAKRRLSELEASGADVPSFEEIKNQIAERDQEDSTRKTAPLRKADDAIPIDTTSLTLDQVVSQLEKLIREKMKAKP